MRLKNKIKMKIDDIKNRKEYKAVFKRLGRDPDKDIGSLSRQKIELKMDKDIDYNQIVINDSVVAQGTFTELAVLYHFLKRCVYR